MQLLDCKLQLGTKSYNWEIRRTEEFKVRIEKIEIARIAEQIHE